MIDIALKEWACVCDLLVEGRVCLLLRKGGVHEHDGPGRFTLEHDRFAFFPAWEHENLDWIKPAMRPGRGPVEQEPDVIELRGFGEVAGLWEVPSRAAFDQLDDFHPWLSPQIDMRFNYKPDRPLYAMLVRAYRLTTPKTIPNRVAFAGCRSWVPLAGEDAADPRNAEPALEAALFDEVQRRVERTLTETSDAGS
jgi:hypothetical protein